MWGWWIAAAVAGDLVCPEVPGDALVEAARRVQTSWLALDAEAYELGRHQVQALLPCVDRALRVDEAVALHVAHGLLSFSDEDLEASRRAFAAVHALQPGWAMPPDVLAPEHPLSALIAGSVTLAGRPGVPIAVAPVHGWSVDGARFPRPDDPRRESAYTLPGHRAFVLQVFGEDGAVVYTGYHASTVDIPVAALVVANDAELVHRKRRQVARSVGSGVAAGLLAGAGVALGAGLSARGAIDGATPAEVDQLTTRANVLGGTAIGLGTAGAALFGITWAVRW